MQLEQFVEQLEGAEPIEYQALVEESQNGGQSTAGRSGLPVAEMKPLEDYPQALVQPILL